MRKLLLSITLILPLFALAEYKRTDYPILDAKTAKENDTALLFGTTQGEDGLTTISLNKISKFGKIGSFNFIHMSDNGIQSWIPIRGYSREQDPNINYEFTISRELLKNSYFEICYYQDTSPNPECFKIYAPKGL